MYTRNINSQQNYQNYPLESALIGFKSHFNERTINDYKVSLRGDGSAIFRYLMRYRFAPYITLKNETIAQAVGCVVRTVQRWTKKFVEDGFLTKTQVSVNGISTVWSPNRYHLGLTKAANFAYWSDENPDKADLYNTHGILVKRNGSWKFQYETVIHNKSYINNKYIYKQSHTGYPIRVTCARVKRVAPSWDIGSKKSRRREKLRESLVMLQEEQRKWIQRNKKSPILKDQLLKDPLRSHIFTEEIEEISTLLDLNERERLKLVAFPDEAIDHLLSVVKPIVTRTNKRAIDVKDRMAWVMSILRKFCTSHNITVDWKWYFDVCEIVGIKALENGEDPRPLKFDGIKPMRRSNTEINQPMVNGTSAEYRRSVEFKGDPIFRESREEEIQRLEKELADLRIYEQDPIKYFGAFPLVLEININRTKNSIKSIEERLKLLKEEYEA